MSALPPPLPEVQLSALAYTVEHWIPRGPDSIGGERDPFDLSAPYQRGSVWTTGQRRALIRSLYMGVPVGAVIISVLPYTEPYDYRVVDGKQRIEAARAWYTDEFGVPGWWFRERDVQDRALPDARFSDLTQQGRRVFGMHASLPALQFNGQVEYLGQRPDGKGWITRDRTPEELLRAEAELYGLINGGGTPQTPEDMDRAAALSSVAGEGPCCVNTPPDQKHHTTCPLGLWEPA